MTEVTRKIMLVDWMGDLESQLEKESAEFGFRYRRAGTDQCGGIYEMTGEEANLDRWAEHFELEWEP